MKKYIPYILGTVLAAFGLLTLFLSTSLILDLFGVREREGNYVLLVVWANFSASLLYLTAAFGLFMKKQWPPLLLAVAALILIAAFVGLMIHVANGGLHETKTIGAMLFRISVTLTIGLIAHFNLKSLRKLENV